MLKENVLETIEYKSHKIEVGIDQDTSNPTKDWDMLGKFICFHRNYDLSNDSRFKTKEEVVEYIKKNKCRLYNLYLYDHSGITISLKPFHCPWDSGQVGWVMVEVEDIRKEYKVKRISQKLWKKIDEIVASEVDAFDMYLRGDIYAYSILDEAGFFKDGCAGYYGDAGKKDMITEAKGVIDYWEENKEVTANIS